MRAGPAKWSLGGNGEICRSACEQASSLEHGGEHHLFDVSRGSAYIARLSVDGNGVRRTTETITKYYYAQLGPYRRLVAMQRPGALYFVNTDRLGGTNILSDANGSELGEVRYHSFGQTRVQTGTVSTDKLFTGQTLDASSGLYFYGARYYDGALGRFTQPDSIVPRPGNPQSLNRHSYALNSPLKYVDPTGNYVMFVGGMGTGSDEQKNQETWGFLIEQLGLKEGEYGFFDWGKGWVGPERLAPNLRPLDDAAGALSDHIAGKTDIRVIGHSRGGALVTEYLAQVAEGGLPANKELAGAYTIDAALASLNSVIENPIAGERYQRFGPFVVGDRYANLPSRLAGRGLTVDIATFDNPADFPFTTHEGLPGIPRYEWAVGPAPGEYRTPISYWRAAHGMLLSDPRVATYLQSGYRRGGW